MKNALKTLALLMAILLLGLALFSCSEEKESDKDDDQSSKKTVPLSDPDEVYAMLESNGYSMAIGSSGINYEGFVRDVSGIHSSGEILILYFENSSYADAAYEKMKPLYKSAGYTIEKHENMVYAGKGTGIEAAAGPLASGIQA